MRFMNEADSDRAVRTLAGIGLLYAGWVLWSGTLSLVFSVVGAVVLLTGIIGWCPAYALFHISTNKVSS